ncbi:E3 ubiquitin-protein ligase TRIM39-like [Hippoglossus stenolepis]|uniref:E3 ubiquitin-protein ligase TRIM39-like n=1 Tax=Hippoglossus stenolepis TaxID=195615 RepID=UPI00159C8C1A|nr:E3 ubiquitin-protein ligase TRIM39-like [Hippoglossus stenolepis]
MASASGFLSEDQFMCSICLDFFTEPVSIPCGHNFCKACISTHWKGKEQCQCPLCNEKFSKGLKLCVNTGFREVVENFRKQSVSANNDVLVKAGQVPCDRCTGKKFRASKTCLVCLASYCETHLEPHRRIATLQKHRLADPLQNLESNVCKEHNRMMELFCRDDLTRVCVQCTEHKAHDKVPLEEEYEETKVQLEQKKEEVQEMIQERQRKVQELMDDVDMRRKQKDEAKVNSSQVFSTFVVSFNRGLHGLLRELEEKQSAAERQAEVLVKELEREIIKLQKRITKLESISHTEDHLQLIKRFLSCSSSLPCKNWSDISISGQHRVEDVKRALTELAETLAKETERASREFKVSCDKIIGEETEKWVDTYTDLEMLPEGTKLDAIRQRFEVDMTFDPCTASDLLLFSEDLKQVHTPHVLWISNIPKKFNRYAYVLGNKGFSEGRFYYEVQVTMKTGWDLGVVRESVRGKKTFTPNPRTGAWIIRLKNINKFSALNNVSVNLRLINKPERVGVFVDHEQRRVSFYDVDTATLIYSFTDCTFNEKIYPFFSPGLPEEGINGGPLVLSPTPLKISTTTKEETQETYQFYAMILFLVVVLFHFIGSL